jgi:hypothetical protein
MAEPSGTLAGRSFEEESSPEAEPTNEKTEINNNSEDSRPHQQTARSPTAEQKEGTPNDKIKARLDPPDDDDDDEMITDDEKDPETATDATAESAAEQVKATIVVSSSKKSRPPYKYDPEKITLRFLFANRDGLAVTVECKPSDTVGEVKGALISVWPKGKRSLLSFSGGHFEKIENDRAL